MPRPTPGRGRARSRTARPRPARTSATSAPAAASTGAITQSRSTSWSVSQSDSSSSRSASARPTRPLPSPLTSRRRPSSAVYSSRRDAAGGEPGERRQHLLGRVVQRVDRAGRRGCRVVQLVREARRQGAQGHERLALAGGGLDPAHRVDQAVDEVQPEGEPLLREAAQLGAVEPEHPAGVLGPPGGEVDAELVPRARSRRPTGRARSCSRAPTPRCRPGGSAPRCPRAAPTSSRRGVPRRRAADRAG